MQTLEGYQHLEKIYESNKTIIYRGLDEKNDRPVILKKLNKEYPTQEETSIFLREYELISKFDNEGVIHTFEKITVDNSPLIIMEDIGGKSLAELLPSMQLKLEEVLNLCIRITEILGNIHKHNIIHKDINPSNIIWNMENNGLRIIDFDLATELPREITSVKNPNVLEGTLPYISPEQTGRMNRSMDYRTDYYSLGITFYWMFTGKLPFESTDPLQLVHSHIAIQPDSPHDLDGNISKTISGIIMKLMSKNAEDRYQSSHGLISDIERCLHNLKNKGDVGTFELGQQDISSKFRIPEKLYGRNMEINTLMSAFDQVKNGKTELMLVSGFSGIGKTVLINEIQKPIIKHNGYFIKGKFEKFKKNIPYYGFIQAFTDFTSQILAEGDEKINEWKQKMLSVLGSNGKILTNMVPLIESIIGKQPDIIELDSVESENRFNLLMQDFIIAIANNNHPVVIFLDDLQWADMGSLHLFKLYSTVSEINHLYFIGTYRHNETPDSHPLMLILNEIKKTGKQINNIFLQPLKINCINHLLFDTLNHPSEDTKPLAELLKNKTSGNPFFINELLKLLYNKSLIKFSYDKGWIWDMAGISAMEATENVVVLLVGKIVDLEHDTQEVLKLGSCIGNYFYLDTLLSICKKPEKEILNALKIGIKEGLLNRTDNIYKFSHDRVQEAVFSLIAKEKKAKLHYHIGTLELKNTENNELDEKIFYIVNQLNWGIAFVTSKSERHNLSELNLKAGKKALASNAYSSSLNYFKTGITLLPENSWNDDYDFTLLLFQEAAIAAHLCAEYDTMEKMAGEVIQNAKSILDTIKIYETEIFACKARSQFLTGIRIGLRVLKKLGIKIPENPNKLHIIYTLLKIKLLLVGKSYETLIDLPEMKDPYKLAIMQTISSIASTTFTSMPKLFPLLVVIVVRLSIKYGHSIYSPYAYAGSAVIYCGALGDINTGYMFGKLALNLVEKFNIKKTKSRVWLIVWHFINHRKRHIQNCLKPLHEAYKTGVETGDLEFAATSATFYHINSFFTGIKLTAIERDMRKYYGIIKRLNQDSTFHIFTLYQQIILNLQGMSTNPCKLDGTSYNINKMLPIHKKTNDRHMLYQIYYSLLNLNYLFEKYSIALKNSEKCKSYINIGRSSVIKPLLYYYDSLARLALYPTKKVEQKKILTKVAGNQKKMKEWALNAPMNYSHKYHLVEGEIARVLEQKSEAIEHYDIAVKLAHENRFLQEEALSMELTAKFWLGLDNLDLAGFYMSKAYRTYQMWGATAKVEQLGKRYTNLLPVTDEIASQLSFTSGSQNMMSPRTSTQILDLASLMKASTILSGEIVLDKLLEKMMRIVMENAGANKGIFILKHGKKWYIEAEGTTKFDEFKILSSLSLNEIDDKGIVPKTVVNYVIHSSTDLVLEDAVEKG
ncbi:MAG: serine/threonine-protein kinase PknK, partial [Deltaproteobacteria bacterium]|nr:serine/threonine-protein kinase PknK [Deltaproteobacteria bacterium]